MTRSQRIGVGGSPGFPDLDFVWFILDLSIRPTDTIVARPDSGEVSGLAVRWASENDIPVEGQPPLAMLLYFWDGEEQERYSKAVAYRKRGLRVAVLKRTHAVVEQELSQQGAA